MSVDHVMTQMLAMPGSRSWARWPLAQGPKRSLSRDKPRWPFCRFAQQLHVEPPTNSNATTAPDATYDATTRGSIEAAPHSQFASHKMDQLSFEICVLC